jgi:hypothetical protein
VLSPFDDYPIHQVALPIAQAGGGHPDFYDRFWFNGYTEDFFFALAMGIYPNRGVIDAAFSVVHDGVQRSVFASGRAPIDRSLTEVGPIRVEIVQPMRRARIVVDAPDEGLTADLVFRTRTAAFEEPRQTRFNGVRLAMDVTRATQLGRWEGSLRSGAATIDLRDRIVAATKDRSWGIRPVGDPAHMAPIPAAAQWFFLWAPLHFDHECLHYMVFEDGEGRPWSEAGVVLPVLGATDPVTGPGQGVEHLADVTHHVNWAPGLRRSDGATLTFRRPAGSGVETVDLEPLMTFRMSGVGYSHPTFAHGRWHEDLIVAGEEFPVDQIDNLDLPNIHVQQVMRASWGDRRGLGVLEQLAIGPHRPSGFVGLNDAATGRPGQR